MCEGYAGDLQECKGYTWVSPECEGYALRLGACWGFQFGFGRMGFTGDVARGLELFTGGHDRR